MLGANGAAHLGGEDTGAHAMTALDELREAIGLVDGLRLAGPCLSRASADEMTRALVERRRALARVEAELAELRANAKPRKFPIQRSAPVPWSVAEIAYREYARQYGTSQSLDRLAERGGFSVGEMDDFYPEWRNAVDQIQRLEAELAALRETNTKLHRRCQSAEKGLAAKLDAAGGASLGRALANSAATMYSARLRECEAQLAAPRKRPTLEQVINVLRDADVRRLFNGDVRCPDAAEVARTVRAPYGEPETR